MPDLVVIVPGILGSKLSRDGSEIWGYSAMLRHPRLLGSRLTLQPNDTAQATGLLSLPVHLPGLGRTDVYGPVVDSLTSEFELQPGENFVLFAYDWRRSCRESALALRRTVDEALQRWRLSSSNERAGVVLVCHSMGGLVARWYLDVLLREEPTDHVRALITIGTPYRGAVEAAGAIVNGVLGWTGASGRRLTEALRGFPSVYELLPQFPCVVDLEQSARRAPLAAVDIDWPRSDLVGAAAEFHAEIAACQLRYDLQAVVSKMQRTADRVHVIGTDRIKLLKGDEAGDGTVPRAGAEPYGWQSMSAAKWIDQSHSTMHNGSDTWTQLHGIFTEWRVDMSLFTGLSLSMPEVIPSGATFTATVRPTALGARPLLQLDLTNVDADPETTVEQRLLDEADGLYSASIDVLAPGTYRATVHDPSGVGGVTPISDLVSVV